MQVFKVYFKIIQKNLPQMLIYLVVFVALAAMFTNFSPTTAIEDFTETKISIAIINEDTGAEFAEQFADYLGKHAVVKDVGTEKNQLMDALFFREVSYILRIPKGFSASFLSGDNASPLQKSVSPDSSSSVQMDYLVSRYLSLATLYNKALPELSAQELAQYITGDLAKGADVGISTNQKIKRSESLLYYFRYYAYSIMAIMVLGVTSIMMVFGKNDIKRRNYASPIKNLSFNLQLVLGNMVFAAVTWAVMCGFGFILYPDEISTKTIVPLLLNSFVYTLVCLALSLFCGNLIKSKNAQSAIANVMALGLCFISGVFVPQELLGTTVQRIASFTPTYWYVNAIKQMSDGFTPQGVTAMLVQFAFAVAFISISLAISRYKSTSDQ